MTALCHVAGALLGGISSAWRSPECLAFPSESGSAIVAHRSAASASSTSTPRSNDGAEQPHRAVVHAHADLRGVDRGPHRFSCLSVLFIPGSKARRMCGRRVSRRARCMPHEDLGVSVIRRVQCSQARLGRPERYRQSPGHVLESSATVRVPSGPVRVIRCAARHGSRIRTCRSARGLAERIRSRPRSPGGIGTRRIRLMVCTAVRRAMSRSNTPRIASGATTATVITRGFHDD